jgi:hypothetical protein
MPVELGGLNPVVFRNSLVFDSFRLVRTNGPFTKFSLRTKIASRTLSDVHMCVTSSYAPARVVTIFRDGVEIKETLRMVPVNKGAEVQRPRSVLRKKELVCDRPLPQKHYPHIRSRLVKENDASIDTRKEQCARVDRVRHGSGATYADGFLLRLIVSLHAPVVELSLSSRSS